MEQRDICDLRTRWEYDNRWMVERPDEKRPWLLNQVTLVNRQASGHLRMDETPGDFDQ